MQLHYKMSRSDDEALYLQYRSLSFDLIENDFYTEFQRCADPDIGGTISSQCELSLQGISLHVGMFTMERAMGHADPASWAWVCKFTFLRGILEFGRGGPNARKEAIMDFENIAPIGDSEHPANKCLDIIRSSEHEDTSTQDIMRRMMTVSYTHLTLPTKRIV